MADTTTTTTTATPPAAPAAPAAPVAAPSTDVLSARGPALSATSDIPVLTAAPPPADTTAAPAPADGTESAKGDAAEREGDGKGVDTTPAWQKAEITKERNRRRAAEELATKEREAREAAERRLDEALKLAPKPTDPAAATPTEPPRPKRPTRDQFDDPDAFDQALAKHEDALIEWSAKRAAVDTSKAAEEQRKADEKKAADERKAEEQRVAAEAAAKTWAERRTKAIADIPDYEAVAEADGVTITVPMAQEIVRLTNGPQVAYHLGKNPAEAERIAALAPIDAVVELRILARQIAAPKPPEISNAPDPVRTVGARAAATRKGPEEESMAEYAARRQQELRGAAH